MHVFLIRRLLAAVPVIIVVTVFVFALLHLAPGDPAAIIAGDLATAEDIAKIRAKLGLDQPLLVQFFTWVGPVAARRPRQFDLLRASGFAADRPAPGADAHADGDDARHLRHAGGAAGRDRGVARRLVDRSLRDGLRGVRLLGARVRDRLRADLAVRDRARLAAGAGLHAARAGFLAVARQHHPAQRDAGARLHGADRAHHARGDARDAVAGLHPHRAREGPGDAGRAAAATRCATRRSRSSP